MMLDATHSWCAKCKQHGLLFPLHGEKGGPMVCLTCRGAWHAEHGKRRNLGRVVIRAIKAFLNAGGSIRHVDDLKLTALCSEGFGGGIPELEDPLGYLHCVAKLTDKIIELTSELLNEAIALTHPDKHPPERREQATRVTQKLTDLKPFVFPGPQPKPPPPARPRNASVNVQSADLKEPSRPAYPCPQCKATTPYFYCDACKAEHNKRWEVEREHANAKQRQWYARRKARKVRRAPPKLCPCGAAIEGKRKDARYCSDACRQRAQKSPPEIGVDIAPMIPKLLEAMPRWERP